ncbi:F-box domain-containing protein [Mycena kentingensis (nom. inval.)]|nr:F-box domain-containing protein [Mycena kentingensis (nom. inval.)]
MHLLLLIHGLAGQPIHLAEAVRIFTQKHPNVHILVARAFSDTLSLDGIDINAQRVLEELDATMLSLNQRTDALAADDPGGPPRFKISILGYSLGGLVARYLIGLLFLRGFFDTVEPVNFATFTTPHIGIPPPPFMSRFWYNLGVMLLGRTGRQLYLLDKYDEGGQPLLCTLANPESAFCRGLALFENVSIYANAVNDVTVPYFTGAIEESDPYAAHRDNEIVPEYLENYVPLLQKFTIQTVPHRILRRPRTFNGPLIEWLFPWNMTLYLLLPITIPAVIIYLAIYSPVVLLMSRRRIKKLLPPPLPTHPVPSPSEPSEIMSPMQLWMAVAERILYASISITDTISSDAPWPWRTLRCLHSIRSRLHLVETIRRLQLRWQRDDTHSAWPRDFDLANACSEASIALKSLIFLEGLDVFLGPANRAPSEAGIHAIERLLAGCSFPHLRYLSLGAEWAKSYQPYTAQLPAFLSLLPVLRHLRLSDHHAPIPFPGLAPTTLPRLTYFRGSPDTAASLLPGRPVQHLALIGQDWQVNRENLPRFALTSVPLRTLDLSAMQVRPVLLRNIARDLPDIHHLKVRLALRHTLHYALSGITILAGLSPVLHDFHHLVSFDLSPTETEMRPVQQTQANTLNFAEEVSLCAQWLRDCPTLRRISFPSGHQWQLDETATGEWVMA